MAERPESPCIYHLFPARFDDRDRMAGLLRDAGIETGVHYDRAVHGHAAWDDHPLRHGDLPIAEAWAAQELSLPMHPDLTEEWRSSAWRTQSKPQRSGEGATSERNAAIRAGDMPVTQPTGVAVVGLGYWGPNL